MSPELVSILAQIMVQQATVLGMQADNMQREAIGDSMAWTGADGRMLRDVDNRVVYETQAEWLARQGCPAFKSAGPAQLGLFA